MIAVGSKAPDFILKDQDGKQVKLSELKGKKVLLSFHPLAWTWVCAEQMKSLEANYERLGKLNTVALGLSVDAVPTKKAWARELAIEKTRLLSDFWPHGEVAKSYDIFREKDGFSERANIIVDEDQKVIFAKIYPISQVPDIEEVIEFLTGKK
jgi:peroxiredoxin